MKTVTFDKKIVDINITSDFEAFNFVRKQLKEQGEKSKIDEGSCVYRVFDENDKPVLKCAAGWLIDDDVYSSSYEGMAIDCFNPVVTGIQKSSPNWNVDHNSLTMIMSLQMIHDDFKPEEWEIVFKVLENYFDENGNFKKTANLDFAKIFSIIKMLGSNGIFLLAEDV